MSGRGIRRRTWQPRRVAKRSSRVPTGRIERLARLGLLGAGFAIGGLAEGAKRLVGAGEKGVNPFLTGANAALLAKRLSKMRGAALKMGQLLSLQSADLVPPEFAKALSMVRDDADTMPPAQLRRVLGREYGSGWEKRFERFDMEPIASASIGQVHAARTKDGRDLALKIQYPGVAKSIDSDLDSLATLLTMTRVLPLEIDAKGIAAEAKEQLHREADYLEEARSLTRYAKLVKGSEKECVVPRVHDDFTTTRILAMELMEGTPFEAFMERPGNGALKDRLGATLLRLSMRELFEFRFVQTDPNFANYLVDETRERLVLLDLGGAREYGAASVEAFRRLLSAGRKADRAAIRRCSEEMDFLPADSPDARVEAFIDLVLLIAEPLHAKGAYDFGATDLAKRVNHARLELVFKRGYLRAPPPWTLFLLRKFAGIYFLLARLGARVDVAAQVDPFLQ